MKDELEKEYLKPCLIFYIEYNSEYGKVYSMDDIEKPSEELYSYYEGDCMTLGRGIHDYERWCDIYMKSELERKKRCASCRLSVEKFAIRSFADIESFYEEEKLNIIKFIDPLLNKYFKIKIENENNI